MVVRGNSKKSDDRAHSAAGKDSNSSVSDSTDNEAVGSNGESSSSSGSSDGGNKLKGAEKRKKRKIPSSQVHQSMSDNGASSALQHLQQCLSSGATSGEEEAGAAPALPPLQPKSSHSSKPQSKKGAGGGEKASRKFKKSQKKSSIVDVEMEEKSEDDSKVVDGGGSSKSDGILLTERGFLVPCGTGKKRKTMELFENYLFRPKRSKTDYTAHYYKEPASKNSSFDSDNDNQMSSTSLSLDESTVMTATSNTVKDDHSDDSASHAAKDPQSSRRESRRKRPSTTSESSEDSFSRPDLREKRKGQSNDRSLASDFEGKELESGGMMDDSNTGDDSICASSKSGVGKATMELDETLEAKAEEGDGVNSKMQQPPPPREERGRRKKGKAERRVVNVGPAVSMESQLEGNPSVSLTKMLTDRETDKSVEKAIDGVLDKGTDRSSDRCTDRGADRCMDRGTDASSEREAFSSPGNETPFESDVDPFEKEKRKKRETRKKKTKKKQKKNSALLPSHRRSDNNKDDDSEDEMSNAPPPVSDVVSLRNRTRRLSPPRVDLDSKKKKNVDSVQRSTEDALNPSSPPPPPSNPPTAASKKKKKKKPDSLQEVEDKSSLVSEESTSKSSSVAKKKKKNKSQQRESSPEGGLQIPDVCAQMPSEQQSSGEEAVARKSTRECVRRKDTPGQPKDGNSKDSSASDMEVPDDVIMSPPPPPPPPPSKKKKSKRQSGEVENDDEATKAIPKDGFLDDGDNDDVFNEQNAPTPLKENKKTKRKNIYASDPLDLEEEGLKETEVKEVGRKKNKRQKKKKISTATVVEDGEDKKIAVDDKEKNEEAESDDGLYIETMSERVANDEDADDDNIDLLGKDVDLPWASPTKRASKKPAKKKTAGKKKKEGDVEETLPFEANDSTKTKKKTSRLSEALPDDMTDDATMTAALVGKNNKKSKSRPKRKTREDVEGVEEAPDIKTDESLSFSSPAYSRDDLSEETHRPDELLGASIEKSDLSSEEDPSTTSSADRKQQQRPARPKRPRTSNAKAAPQRLLDEISFSTDGESDPQQQNTSKETSLKESILLKAQMSTTAASNCSMPSLGDSKCFIEGSSSSSSISTTMSPVKNLSRKCILQDLENEELDVLYKLGCFSPAYHESKETDPPRCFSPCELLLGGDDDEDPKLEEEDDRKEKENNIDEKFESDDVFLAATYVQLPKPDEDEKNTLQNTVGEQKEEVVEDKVKEKLHKKKPKHGLSHSPIDENHKKSGKSDRKKSSKKSKSPRRGGNHTLV